MPTLLDFITFVNRSYAKYACDSFGHDTDTPAIWDRVNGLLDLTPGDGTTAATFPTLVVDTDHDTTYYTFDGVDDYVSDWPTMPSAYTVVAALSDSYPGGKPYFQSCNDDTIETLLTTSGSFTGNLHNLMIFDWELSALELLHAEQYQLRRLWRDTFVDPFTARMIRTEECVLCMYCEEEADKFDDYSLNDVGSTDYSTGWDSGLTFPASDSALVFDEDDALKLDSLTIFIEAPSFDLEATSGNYMLQNQVNYYLTVTLAAGICTLSFNTSDFEFTAKGYRTLAVSAISGEKPMFYLNGEYAGEGDIAVSVPSSGAYQLRLGNNLARNNAFESTLKKISIYSAALTADEIRAAHVAALIDRPFTT